MWKQAIKWGQPNLALDFLKSSRILFTEQVCGSLDSYVATEQPKKQIFTTTVLQAEGKNATGLRVPAEIVAALGKQKRPSVRVWIGQYSYRSTIAAYGDVFMLPLSAEHRQVAGVRADDEVQVTLELDSEPRRVEVPVDLAVALANQPGHTEAFEALAYSARKEHVRQIESAKAPETRERRIAAIVAKLRDSQSIRVVGFGA